MESFFFQFLIICNSYQFNMMLIRLLASQIQEFCNIEGIKHIHNLIALIALIALITLINLVIIGLLDADIAHTFTARLCKLKILAKFLGFLTFSPYWALSGLVTNPTNSPNSHNNPNNPKGKRTHNSGGIRSAAGRGLNNDGNGILNNLSTEGRGDTGN